MTDARTEAVARANARRGALVVEELVRLGVPRFCVAPGSRSTPLVAAVARRAPSTVFTDERAAAFFAVGLGRATGRPAVVVTTSGTAVANLWPAVMEADLAGVPLILLTADRPPELRQTGANQAVDQVKVFGDAVRWFAELPCPDDSGFADPAVLTTLDTAFARAVGERGPVQVNCAFRKPLGHDVPGPIEVPGWGDGPWTRAVPARRMPHLDELAARLSTARGLVVVGALDAAEDRAAARALVEHLGWPVHADVTSGLRLGGNLPGLLAPFDTLLQSPSFRRAARPEVVLELGGPVVSLGYREWLARIGAFHVRVARDLRRRDPAHTVRLQVEADLSALVPMVTEIPTAIDVAWRDRLVEAARAARAVVPEGWSEPAIACAVCRELGPDGLFVASSMPVRDLDWFGPVGGPVVPVSANRGASGIDGTVATAAGWSCGRGRRAALLVGDQALLHDVGSLALLREHPLVVVVVNNGGGGIFSLLPVAAATEVFERHFANAHDWRFAEIARAFGIEYRAPQDLAALKTALCEATAGPWLVEVRTDRAENARLHRALAARRVEAAERVLARTARHREAP